MKTSSTLLPFTIVLLSLWSCQPKGSTSQTDVDSIETDSVKTYTADELGAICSILNRHDPLKLYAQDTSSNPYENLGKTLLSQLDSSLNEQQTHQRIMLEIGKLSQDSEGKMKVPDLARDVLHWLKTGNYLNEKDQLHINSFFMDENEINSDEYRPYVPDTTNPEE